VNFTVANHTNVSTDPPGTGGRPLEIRAAHFGDHSYRGADKSLARPGRKQATATEDFDVHISYLLV